MMELNEAKRVFKGDHCGFSITLGDEYLEPGTQENKFFNLFIEKAVKAWRPIYDRQSMLVKITFEELVEHGVFDSVDEIYKHFREMGTDSFCFPEGEMYYAGPGDRTGVCHIAFTWWLKGSVKKPHIAMNLHPGVPWHLLWWTVKDLEHMEQVRVSSIK